MADLLECLIQIKGVADTPRRLTARLASSLRGGRERLACSVVARLAAAEARFASCLGLMLAADGAALPSIEIGASDLDADRPLGDLLEEFGRRRRQVVDLLERCTAADLNRTGFEPSRGPMTVADLVAVMLAHDTDQLGKLI